MILGTAGHIDHGKTALVAALTGVDTDRLPEERRRGITIELGFAPLALDGVGTVGVVDVPGHEAFVRTMLAGATGIDLALLVVAADEGVMPQTREHVAILSLLGVRGGVIALTKRDLVDEEWLALVADDVRTLVAETPLASAPLVPVSAVTGAGLDDLRAALATAAHALPARDGDDFFRLPVDRAFTVRGTGTVVTGTVWTGRVTRDATVRILPGTRTARVRGVQSHGAARESAQPGTRAAIALAGVEVGDVGRGAVLVTDAAWEATRLLRADVALLDSAPTMLGPRTRVRFHLGTADVGARIVAEGGAVTAGSRRAARVMLDEPVVARTGDRFVLRNVSPVTTIGGGVVTDPLPPTRRPRLVTGAGLDSATLLDRLIEEAGVHGVSVATLPLRLGSAAAVTAALAARGDRIVRLGDRYYGAAALEFVAARLDAAVAGHHEAHPLEPGASLQAMRVALHAPAGVVERALELRVASGTLIIDRGLIRQEGWTPRLTIRQRSLMDAIRATLGESGREPPSVGELVATHGPDVEPLLRLLEREGAVVLVEEGRYYAAPVVQDLLGHLLQSMEPGREYGPSELRDVLGVSRKYLIPILEYADRQAVTTRRGSGRVVSVGVARERPMA
ncbi:MAG: selenocysteine-specific translation elongation factor [Gemmatimonadaceae bacterium]